LLPLAGQVTDSRLSLDKVQNEQKMTLGSGAVVADALFYYEININSKLQMEL
jgi:hypothetical protein